MPPFVYLGLSDPEYRLKTSLMHLGGLVRQVLDPIGNDGKAFAGLPCPRSFNDGVQGQKIGLFGNIG